MYFQDLSPYQYGRVTPTPNVLSVGWLSGDHPYSSGAVSDAFVEALRHLVAQPVNLYRGRHMCEFCPEPPIITNANGLRMLSPPEGTTGNGEIRVSDNDGTTYVAPVLVLHYVVAHGYLPPPQFVAVCEARYYDPRNV